MSFPQRSLASPVGERGMTGKDYPDFMATDGTDLTDPLSQERTVRNLLLELARFEKTVDWFPLR